MLLALPNSWPRTRRPGLELLVSEDGAEQEARDLEDTRVLREVGWTVVRIWEHEPLDVAVKTVLDALNGESI